MKIRALVNTYPMRVVDDGKVVTLINEKTRDVEVIEVKNAKDKAMLAYAYLTEKGLSVMSQTEDDRGGLTFHLLDTDKPKLTMLDYSKGNILPEAISAIESNDRTIRLWDGQSNLSLSFDRVGCKTIHLKFHDLDDEFFNPLDKGMSWDLVLDLMQDGEKLFDLLFNIAAFLKVELWFGDESTILRSFYRFEGENNERENKKSVRKNKK